MAYKTCSLFRLVACDFKLIQSVYMENIYSFAIEMKKINKRPWT